MNNFNRLLTLTALAASISGCQSTTDKKAANNVSYSVGDTVEAAVNIHVEAKTNHIYSSNYQFPSLVPVCSKFTIDSISTTQIKLTNNETQYTFLLDEKSRQARHSLSQEFEMNFAKQCDSKKLVQLNEVDKKGIKEGKALIGMSKEGVIFAMGYPPEHATIYSSNFWLYWRSGTAQSALAFSKEGKVYNIE